MRALLQVKGYTKVIMSAESRTPIDMLASNGATVLAVQVKQGGHFAESDRRQLVEWAGCFQGQAMLLREGGVGGGWSVAWAPP